MRNMNVRVLCRMKIWSVSQCGMCVFLSCFLVMLFLATSCLAEENLRTLICQGMVRSMAFSPNGQYIVVGSADEANNIFIYEVESGQLVKTFSGHNKDVGSLAFSPDGKMLASGSEDATIRIWDVASGNALHTLSGHSDYVNGLAFSPDGKLLASGSEDKTTRIWESATGQLLRTFGGSKKGGVAFSPDGKFLATGTLEIWDPASGQLIQKPNSGNYSCKLLYSPDGKYLATQGAYAVNLRNVTTGEILRELKGGGDIVTGVSFSPDSKLIAIGSYEGTISIYNPITGQKISSIATKYCYFLNFSPDNKLLVSANRGELELREMTSIRGEISNCKAAYESAANVNKAEGYQQFITQHSSCPQVVSAREKIESAKDNTISAECKGVKIMKWESYADGKFAKVTIANSTDMAKMVTIAVKFGGLVEGDPWANSDPRIIRAKDISVEDIRHWAGLGKIHIEEVKLRKCE